MTRKINVFCLEDHKIMRDGIRLMLAKYQDVKLVGDSSAVSDLIRSAKKIRVDIVLLDIYLEGTNQLTSNNGFDICAKLKKIAPDVRVVAHSAYDDADRVAAIMRAGANGFVSKTAGFTELVNAIRLVASGQKYICHETTKRLKNAHEFLADMRESLENKDEYFSKREREVLMLLSKGHSTREIAMRLFIAEKTVESHRNSLIRKAKVKNSAQLTAYAAMRGLITK